MQRKSLIQFRKAIKKTQEEMANTWGIGVSFYKQVENKTKTQNTDKIFLT